MSFAALACVQHFVWFFFCVCKQKSLASVLLWHVECNSICSYMVPWLNLTFPPEHELDNPRKLSNIISPPGLMDLHLLWYNQQQFTVLPSKLVTQELPATSSKIMLQHDFQAVGLISWQSYFLAVVLKKNWTVTKPTKIVGNMCLTMKCCSWLQLYHYFIWRC